MNSLIHGRKLLMLFKIRILNKLKKLNGNKIVEKVHIKSN